jgi:hypothetical protein
MKVEQSLTHRFLTTKRQLLQPVEVVYGQSACMQVGPRLRELFGYVV